MTRIVPLAEVRPPDMEAVLQHEQDCWLGDLDWDYTATITAIARSIATRSFAGFALLEGERVLAYACFHPDPERSVVGSIHALPEADASGAPSRLLERTLQHLVDVVRPRRIESQFVHFGSDDLAPVFRDFGARRFPREFRRGPLARVLAASCPAPAVHLRPFRPGDAKAVAEAIYSSFLGSPDADMSLGYATLDGCQNFVDGVLTRSGCGVFDAGASLVAVESGRLAAVVLITRISPKTGHVVQISVRPEAQGRGLGRALLAAAAARLERRGLDRLTLSVTVDNARARDWYERLGLGVVRRYDAWVVG